MLPVKSTTKMETLSDKSWKVCSDPINSNYDLDVIEIKDVKESIRLLKEDVRIGLKPCGGLIENVIGLIDKRVGNKLI